MKTPLALVSGAVILPVLAGGAFAASGVHLVTEIRALPHGPGAFRYAVTVRPVGGPAHAVTVVLAIRPPSAWTAMAPGCLASRDRTTVACDLGEVREAEQRTLRLGGTVRGTGATSVVARASAANAPSVTASLGTSALRLAYPGRPLAGGRPAGLASAGLADPGGEPSVQPSAQAAVQPFAQPSAQPSGQPFAQPSGQPSAPGGAGPGSLTPGSAAPGSAARGSAGPGSAGPGSAGPGSAGPGSAGPGSAGPESLAPGSAAPGSASPGSLASGSLASGSAAPGSASQGVGSSRVPSAVVPPSAAGSPAARAENSPPTGSPSVQPPGSEPPSVLSRGAVPVGPPPKRSVRKARPRPHPSVSPAASVPAGALPGEGAPPAPPAGLPAPAVPDLPKAPATVPPLPSASSPPPSAALPQIAAGPPPVPKASPGEGVSELSTLSPAGAMQEGRWSWATLIAVAVVTEAGMLWLVASFAVWRRRRTREDGRRIRALRLLVSRLFS